MKPLTILLADDTDELREATAEGLLFLRAIAMAFDAYLERDAAAADRKFSRIV